MLWGSMGKEDAEEEGNCGGESSFEKIFKE